MGKDGKTEKFINIFATSIKTAEKKQ